MHTFPPVLYIIVRVNPFSYMHKALSPSSDNYTLAIFRKTLHILPYYNNITTVCEKSHTECI